MKPLSAIFIIATIVWTIASLYLSSRQSSFVRRHRDAIPSDFSGIYSMDEHRNAASYTIAREKLSRLESLLDGALAIAWGAGGINLGYRFIAGLVPLSLERGVLFLLLTGCVGAAVSMPFEAYRTFVLEQRFGFNKTTVRQFWIDRLKRGVISLVIATPLLFGLLFVMRELSGLWWLWAWFGLVALMLIAPSIYIRFIAPRFNHFEPLSNPELKSRIESVLARSGFRSSGLFTMDASRRTAHGNAYFIGFGRTKRIVLFDTLIARCTPAEIEAVVAHELGHFLHRHVLFGIIRSIAMVFVVLAAFGWLSKQRWLLPYFGVRYQDDALALFVCVLLASVFGPLLAPFGNWISRRNEYEADDYAGRAVGVEPMVSALTSLARDNASTLTPDPLYSLVHHSHPSVPLRVRRLREERTRAKAQGSAQVLEAR